MARIGEMRCLNPSCSCTDMAVNETAAKNWQATCHKCGFPTFSKAGTRWRRDMEKLVTLDTADAPATPPAKPAKAAATPFALGNL